jgi:predicted membrane-bound spermidine synthase
VLNSLIFTRSSTVPIAHIAPAVVAVFVEAIGAGKLTSADVLAVVGAAEFAEIDRLLGLRVRA